MSDFTVVCVHLDWFFLFVLIRVSFSLLFLFVVCHFFVHFSSRFPRIWCFQLSLLFFTQMLFLFSPLLAIVFFFSYVKLSLSFCLKERSLKRRKQLLSLDPLRRRDKLSIICLQSMTLCNDVILASSPSLTWVASHIYLL